MFAKIAKKLGFAIIFALFFTIITSGGALNRLDLVASDAYYQQPRNFTPKVLVIGIDNDTINELGPYESWNRDIIAQAINILNESGSKPAAIGIALSLPKTPYPDRNKALIEAAQASGNVVLSHRVSSGRSSSMTVFDTPFAGLRGATEQGNVSVVLDRDGILRHHVLETQVSPGVYTPSFAKTLAKVYAREMGIELPSPPSWLGSSMYVHFWGEPGTFNSTVSFVDLIHGRFDPEIFRDKVVIIGPYARAFNDYYLTSINHQTPMYGVEYQANVIQSILEGEYKYELSKEGRFIGIFLTLVSVALILTNLSFIPLNLTSLFLMGLYTVAGKFFYEMDIVGQL